MFAREVNENAAMQAVLADALLWKVDCEKGEGIALAKKFEIRGYPTYIALNGQGEITDSWIGYEGPENWSASVAAAKLDRRTIADKKAAFEAEPTLALARALASDADTGSRYKDAVAYYGAARELDPANAGDYDARILSSMIYGSQEDVFTPAEVVAQAEPAMASDETPVADKLELALMIKSMAEQKDKIELALPFLTAAMNASEGTTDEKALKYRNYLAVDYALLVEKDPDKALGLRRDRLPEGWENDPKELNGFAWWCFQNGLNLTEAQALALKGVELAETDGEKANILDTAAEISHAQGDGDQALAHIRRAIELVPDKAYFKEQLARFEKALQEKNEG